MVDVARLCAYARGPELSFINAAAGAVGVVGRAMLDRNKSKLMVDFNDLLVPETVRIKVPVAGKKQLFQKLAELASDAYGLDEAEIFDRLMERERLGSTGFGGGIAIPHAKLPASGPDIMGVMGICPAGIDFDAPDHRPVHYIIMIATPKEHQDRHLQVMAAVARMISNADIRAKLLTAQTPAEVYEVIEVEPSENYNYFLED